VANGIKLKLSGDEEHECEEDMWFHVSISEVDVSLDRSSLSRRSCGRAISFKL